MEGRTSRGDLLPRGQPVAYCRAKRRLRPRAADRPPHGSDGGRHGQAGHGSGDRSGHHLEPRHRVRRRIWRSWASRSASSPSTIRPRAGWSTIPRTSGARRWRRPGRRWPPPSSAPATSPPSASPTSARPASSGTGARASRSTAPSSGRTGARPTSCRTLKRAGHEPAVTAKTGLLLDPYFSATKIAWLLDHVDGARALAKAGHLAFGTIDSFLLWRLTGGKVHATDATNASRTLLYDIAKGACDDDLLRAVRRAALDAARGARLQCRLRRDRAVDPRRRHPASSASPATSRRPPSARPASRPAWSRPPTAPAASRCSTPATSRSPRATGCSPPSPTSSTASAPTRWRAPSSSPARRCNGCATACASSPRRRRAARSPPRPMPGRTSISCRPSSASARPTGSPRRAARCSA